MNEWLDVARERSVVVRALKYAAVVGSLLVLINHGDAIVSGELSGVRLLKMFLTTLVP